MVGEKGSSNKSFNDLLEEPFCILKGKGQYFITWRGLGRYI